MKVGIVNTYGIAMKYLFYSDMVEAYEVQTVYHELYETVLVLSVVIGFLVAIAVTMGMSTVYSIAYRQFVLDAMFSDPVMRADAIEIMQKCDELFGYDVELNTETNKVSRKWLTLRVPDDNGNDQKVFNELNELFMDEPDNEFWSVMDQANLARKWDVDMDCDGVKDSTAVADMSTSTWLRRAEYLFFDLRKPIEGFLSVCNTGNSDCSCCSRTCCDCLNKVNCCGVPDRGLLNHNPSKTHSYSEYLSKNEDGNWKPRFAHDSGGAVVLEKYDELMMVLEPFVQNLRFLQLVCMPQFFLDRMVNFHIIQRPNASFREALYYSTMHKKKEEAGVVALQLFIAVSSPPHVFILIFTLPYICCCVHPHLPLGGDHTSTRLLCILRTHYHQA